jgi:hypothetical protein
VSSNPFFEASIGLRVAGKIDKLLVGQIARHLAPVDQRDDGLLAHHLCGVYLRLAVARRQPLRRDQRQHDLATRGGLLQGFLPALAGDDAALGVEVEEDVIPAVRGEPIADLDSLVVVTARMTDEKARHGLRTPRNASFPIASGRFLTMPSKPHVTEFTLR